MRAPAALTTGPPPRHRRTRSAEECVQVDGRPAADRRARVTSRLGKVEVTAGERCDIVAARGIDAVGITPAVLTTGPALQLPPGSAPLSKVFDFPVFPAYSAALHPPAVGEPITVTRKEQVAELPDASVAVGHDGRSGGKGAGPGAAGFHDHRTAAIVSSGGRTMLPPLHAPPAFRVMSAGNPHHRRRDIGHGPSKGSWRCSGSIRGGIRDRGRSHWEGGA